MMNSGSSAANTEAGRPASQEGAEDDETLQQRRQLQQASPADHARKRRRRRVTSGNPMIVSLDRTTLSVSPATGLHGLAESRFLSIFLEHYTGMYPVATDESIRDGLMHEFVQRSNRRGLLERQQEQQPPHQQRSLQPPPWPAPAAAAAAAAAASAAAAAGPKENRGHALSCALFSCITVGGLIMGSPLSFVARYMATARSYIPLFEGLADRCAVSCLIAYAMASEYLTGRGPGSEYRKSMDSAKAIFEGLPREDRDPIISAVLTHFMVLDGFPLLQHVEASCSVNPLNSGGRRSGSSDAKKRRTGNGNGNGNGNGSSSSTDGELSISRSTSVKTTSYMCAKTEDGELAFQNAVAGRESISLGSGRPAPPVYVVADALLLGIRFSKDRGDVNTRLRHLHDFASAQLDRFSSEKAGAVALLALCGVQLGVQIRLGLPGGVLHTAKRLSAVIHSVPGLVRIYHSHAAHLSLVVYRLYGMVEEYETLRDLLAKNTGENPPCFLDLRPKTRLCQLHVCRLHAERLLAMEAPLPSSGGGSGGPPASPEAPPSGVGENGGRFARTAGASGGDGGGGGGGEGASAARAPAAGCSVRGDDARTTPAPAAGCSKRGGGGGGGGGDAISSIKHEPAAPEVSEGAKLLSRLR